MSVIRRDLAAVAAFLSLAMACTPAAPPPDGNTFAVLAFSPADGATGVPLGATLVLTMNGAIDPASITGEGAPTVRLTSAAGSPVLPVTWTVGTGAAANQLRAEPPRDLVTYAATWTVTVPRSLARTDGRTLGRNLSWSFTWSKLPALRFVASTPIAGGGVDRAPAFSLTFSEPPDCRDFGVGGTARPILLERRDAHAHVAADAPLPLQGRWSCTPPPDDVAFTRDGACRPPGVVGGFDYCTVRFIPVAEEFPGAFDHLRIAPSSTVEVTLPGDDGGLGASGPPLRSARGGHGLVSGTGALDRTTVLRFHAPDPGPFALLRLGTADLGDTLAPGDGLSLTFSRPPDCASLEGVTITERFDPVVAAAHGTGSRVVTGRWSCEARPSGPEVDTCASDRCVPVFTPLESNGDPLLWRHSSTVTVHVPSGASGVVSSDATTRGGALADEADATLHVVDPPPLVVLTALPASGASGIDAGTKFEWTFSEPPDCDSLALGATFVATPPPELDPTGFDPLVSWDCRRTPADPGTARLPCGGASDPCHVTARVVEPLQASSRLVVTLPGGAPALGELVVSSSRATSSGGFLADDRVTTVRWADPDPLEVFLRSPADGATDVDPGASIELAFSAPPDCSALSRALLVAVDDGAGPVSVPGSVSCPPPLHGSDTTCASDPAACRVTWVPGEPFLTGARVTVFLGRGSVKAVLATSFGGSLTTELSAAFTIRPARPPTIASTSPVRGGALASPQGPVLVDFDVPEGNLACDLVTACTTGESTCGVSARVLSSNGSSRTAPLAITCTLDPPRLTIAPASGTVFPYGTRLELVLSGEGESPVASRLSERVVPLASAAVLPFTVAATPQAWPVQVWPADGQEGLSASASIGAEFAGPLDCATATAGGTVKLQVQPPRPIGSSSQPPFADVPFDLDCDGRRLQLTPSRPPAAASRLRVELLGSVDAPGLGLAGIAGAVPRVTSPYAWEFLRADPEPVAVLSTTPLQRSAIVLDDTISVTFSRPVACTPFRASVQLRSTATGALLPITAGCGANGSTSGEDSASGWVRLLAEPETGASYQLVIAAGLPASDAILRDGSTIGVLTTAVSVPYTGGPSRPFEVVSIDPGPLSSAGLLQPLALTFGRAVAIESVRPCPGEACNVWVSPASSPFSAASRALAIRSVESAGKRVILVPTDTPAGSWVARSSYAVAVLGGSAGPTDTNGRSLAATVRGTFSTGDATIVRTVTPEDGATGITDAAPVCVTLVDDLANPTQARTLHVTLYPPDTLELPTIDAPVVVSGSDGRSANVLCANLVPGAIPGFAGTSRLAPGTVVRVALDEGIPLVGGRTTPAHAWSFTTAAAPALVSARWRRGSSTLVTLADATVWPRAPIELEWSVPVPAASLSTSTVKVLRASGANASYALSVKADGTGRVVVLTPSPGWPAGSVSETFTLRIESGPDGMKSAAGYPPDQPIEIPFGVAASGRLRLIGLDGGLPSGSALQLVSLDEKFAFDTITRFRVSVSGGGWNAIPYTSTQQPWITTLVPVPSIPHVPGRTVTVDPAGVEDETGRTFVIDGDATLPTIPAHAPAPLRCDAAGCPVTPAPVSPGVRVFADGLPGLSLLYTPAANGLPLLATLVTGTTVPSIEWLLDDPDARCPGAPAVIDGSVRVTPVAGGGLSVRVDAKDSLIQAGCQYVVRLNQSVVSSAAGEAMTVSSCPAPDGGYATQPLSDAPCGAPGRATGISVYAESTAPVLTPLRYVDSGGRTSAWSPTREAPGVGSLVIASSEPLRRTSVSASTANPQASLSADAKTLTLTWSTPSLARTLVVDGVTDTSGNRATALRLTPPPDTTPPTFTVAHGSTTDPRAPQGFVDLVFSESMAPPAIATSGTSTEGAVTVRVGGNLRAGALRAVRGRSDVWRWIPLAPLEPGTTVEITIDAVPAGGPADLSGNRGSGTATTVTR